MRRTVTTLAASAALVVAMAAPALAQGKPDFTPPRTPDTECLRAGQETLRSLDAFSAAARGEVNYAVYDSTGAGLINVELGDEAFLPISTVFQLHLDAPSAFDWCITE